MKNIIKNIIAGDNIDEIFSYVLNRLYQYGPIDVSDMEILSYLFLYQPNKFKENQNSILNYMGVFFKNVPRESLKDVVFGQYRLHIFESYNHHYTPVQASIVRNSSQSKCFSFSAPTSTGKSYVFMNQIIASENDVVVIVPSRALINEYYIKLCDLIEDKSINILTFVDKINTKHAKKNVFIVTPERCRDLFKQKDFKVDLFLFDEAQLSDEDSKRGLYFDSIVRRCQKAYPKAKFIFAHPFVKNPESQITKNHFNPETSFSIQYNQKNVGQMFLCVGNDSKFYHFGINKPLMGDQKIACSFDPITSSIKNGGSVLFYIPKSKIFNKSFLNQFKKYIKLCPEIKNPKIDSYIESLKNYTGGNTLINKNHFSQMITLLKRGIVIHHGSLPLQTRMIMEQFTKDGLCRICFATSTLEQGINMPFDVVFLDRLEGSKPLSVKNLIGRAGRSTLESKFDFGYVVVGSVNKMTKLREIMTNDEELSTVSSLEKNENRDDDYNNFKEAILNDTYSDEFNLTEKDLQKLTHSDIDLIIKRILDSVFVGSSFISLNDLNANRIDLYSNFRELYSVFLGRELVDGEKYVLDTAIKIILWRVHGKTFKNICWYRYSYVSQSHKRNLFGANSARSNNLNAAYITGFHDIPDRSLLPYSLFPVGTKAKDVDYDLIMYDTYDFIDKLIGFKLSDIYFASFIKYYEKTSDLRAKRLAMYFKYGTDNERFIWMLRYGMSFEDIEVLNPHIQTIDSNEIVFLNSINQVSDEQRQSVSRFIN